MNVFVLRWKTSQGEAGAGGVLLSVWKYHVHGECAARGIQQRCTSAKLQRCQGNI